MFHFALTLRADFRHFSQETSHKTKIPFNTRAPFPAPAQPPVSQLKGLFWAKIHQKEIQKTSKT